MPSDHSMINRQIPQYPSVKILKHELFAGLKSMRILWVSARVIDKDLCKTTQIALASGLTCAGHDLTLACPGKMNDEVGFKHIQLAQSRVKGFQARSIAKEVNLIKPNQDIILVDWRLAGFLESWLNKSKLPWYLVDRGPPANSGLMARLQWRFWKKAWKMASWGMVVSSFHADFIFKKTGSTAVVDVLAAGVNISDFKPTIHKQGKPRFIYIGKVDANREVGKLPESVLKVGGTLKIVGSGNIMESMKRKWGDHEDIEMIDSVPNYQIPALLSDADVGLLPMPNKNIWKIASPLKLAEYAAAGLFVAGIDHCGHHVPFDAEWLFLSTTMEKAMMDAKQHIGSIEKGGKARSDAIHYMDWENSTRILEASLQRIIQNQNC